MSKMDKFDWFFLVFLILGGLLYAVVGIFNFDLLNWMFGVDGGSRIVKGILGFGMLLAVAFFWKNLMK